ncbi:unnamed protein product [Eruca vesicaria subsp. sativa]|uniref:Transmembrane protein n=1 Tax=Eruca vesicaria subsp. sativa TaxID=29727 RepID=A0ABC8JZ11_ERUVS|nr:unnamed protein product [Eruca vesicaria subsp. sativa]
MTKPFEFHVVEAEKAEAMRRYNNQKHFRNIIRACAVALMFYVWFPTVTVSLLAVGDWFYRTGVVVVTNRIVVFVSANLLVALVFLLSRDRDEESRSKQDLYDQYTSSSSSVIVAASGEKVVDDGDDSEKQTVAAVVEEVVADKQIVPAFAPEVEEKVVVEEMVVTTELKRTYRRTKSERNKKVKRPVTDFRRTESANSAIERLNSEEFRLKIESFIMEKKRCLVQEENDVVSALEHSSSGLELVGA